MTTEQLLQLLGQLFVESVILKSRIRQLEEALKASSLPAYKATAEEAAEIASKTGMRVEAP